MHIGDNKSVQKVEGNRKLERRKNRLKVNIKVVLKQGARV
jgi:hypothetical protein